MPIMVDDPTLNEIARVLTHGCQLRVHSRSGIFYGTFTSHLGEEYFEEETFSDVVHKAYERATEIGPDPTPRRRI